MQLTAEDLEFIRQTLPSIEGWLLESSALLTSGLIRWQAASGIVGGVFEIGVYAGRYLSLHYHLTQQTDERVLGLDTFQWYPREKVDDNFQRVFGNVPRLAMITSDSTLIQAEQITEKMGRSPRFISVDGAHTASAVLSDLHLAQRLLAPGGIVAIDDILNPRAIGVSEGAYRYFLAHQTSDSLAPFAYCGNKLYTARRADLDRFRTAVEEFIKDNPALQVAIDFNHQLAQGRDWVEQQLFGCPVFIL